MGHDLLWMGVDGEEKRRRLGRSVLVVDREEGRVCGWSVRKERKVWSERKERKVKKEGEKRRGSPGEVKRE